MLSAERERETTELCQDVIRIPSLSGKEEQLVQFLMKKAGKAGVFDDVVIDSNGSIIAHIKGKEPGPKVLLDGHIDTVPVQNPEAWKHDPFGGEIEDGKIYGRGASDMKGAVAAMFAAAMYYGKDKNHDFKGEIYVAGVVHEECFEGVGARSISARLKPDCVIIGEPSELNLKRGQRGRAEIVVETYGKPAHSANPDKGINAVYKAVRLIDEIRHLETSSHPVLGKGILELTDIMSLPYPGASVVPSLCRLTYDRRLLVGESREDVLKPIADLIDRLSAEDPEFKASVHYAVGEELCYTGNKLGGERFFPGWLLSDDDPLVVKALAGLKAVGLHPQISHYNFCTNGSHYCGEAGIPTIGFGPSFEHLAHIDDEYIEIEQLLSAVKGYYGILDALLR